MYDDRFADHCWCFNLLHAIHGLCWCFNCRLGVLLLRTLRHIILVHTNETNDSFFHCIVYAMDVYGMVLIFVVELLFGCSVVFVCSVLWFHFSAFYKKLNAWIKQNFCAIFTNTSPRFIFSIKMITQNSSIGLGSFYTELMRGLGASTRIWQLLDTNSSIPLRGIFIFMFVLVLTVMLFSLESTIFLNGSHC